MANKYIAKTTFIFDGDTFKAKDKKGNIHTIRLFGIDAPEKTQEYGGMSSEHLKSLILNKDIQVTPVELGEYGREICLIHTMDGKNINEEMLMAGMAHASGNNHQFSKNYFRLQENARFNGIGLWNQERPQDPAEYRARRKIKAKSYQEAEQLSRQDTKKQNEKRTFLNSIKDFIKKKEKKTAEDIQIEKELKEISHKNIIARFEMGRNKKPKI